MIQRTLTIKRKQKIKRRKKKIINGLKVVEARYKKRGFTYETWHTDDKFDNELI